MTVRDEQLKDFIDGYYKPIDEDLAALRRMNEEADIPLIMTETEGILGLLTDLIRPSHILELGTAHGYSALFFAKKLPDAVITTIDRSPYMIEAARANFDSHKEGARIDFRTGDAPEILRMLAEEAEKDPDFSRFDFVFIDAGKSHYREFFELSEKLCTEDAVIVCDNILMKGWIIETKGEEARRHRTSIKYMRQFIDYINSRDDLEVTLLSGGDGLAIIRFRTHADSMLIPCGSV